MLDPFLILTPILLLPIIALLRFIGCGTLVGSPGGPGITLTANPPLIKPGESSTLNWTISADATSASIDQGIGPVMLYSGLQTQGFHVVGPLTQSTNYTLTAMGPGGPSTAQALVAVTPAPVITGILPATGPAAGGTTVTVNGSNFDKPDLTIGGATAAIVNSADTLVTATTPAHAAGAVDVVVTNTDGQFFTLPNGFTYTSPGPGVPIAFAQVNSGPPTPHSTNVVAVAYSKPQVGGNLNLVVVGWADITASVLSISDTQGNPYVLAAGPTSGTGLRQSIYYAKNIAAGNNTVTVTFDKSAIDPEVSILEYSGVDTQDTAASAEATGTGTAAKSGAATTTHASELIFAAGSSPNGFTTPGPGFTRRPTVPAFNNIVEDQVGKAVGTFNASAAKASGNWVFQMVCFYKS